MTPSELSRQERRRAEWPPAGLFVQTNESQGLGLDVLFGFAGHSWATLEGTAIPSSARKPPERTALFYIGPDFVTCSSGPWAQVSPISASTEWGAPLAPYHAISLDQGALTTQCKMPRTEALHTFAVVGFEEFEQILERCQRASDPAPALLDALRSLEG